MKPCRTCFELDGEASSRAPHAELTLATCLASSRAGVPRGAVEFYRCRACAAELQRFCKTDVLDGWLLRRPKAAALH